MSIQGRLVSAFYRSKAGSNPTLYMAVRTKDGKVFPEPVKAKERPYFYIEPKDLRIVELELQSQEIDYEIERTNLNFALAKGKAIKCYLWEPWRVGNFKRFLRKEHKIDLHEADIPYIRRIKIDNKIKAGIRVENNNIYPYDGEIPPPRLLFIDIEVDDSNGFPEVPGEYKILCIGTTNEEGIENFFTWEYGISTENQMMKNFYKYALDYDYLVVWNKDFESKHIPERCKTLGSYHEWRVFRWLDLAEFYRMYRLENHYEKLPVAYDNILKKFRPKLNKLQIIKHDRLERLPNYYDAWKNNRKRLQEVNSSHAYALFVMEKAMEVISLYSDVADDAGIFADFTTMNSHIVDTMAMRANEDAKRKWVVPSSGEYSRETKGFRGAVVFPAKRGIHPFLFLFDFTSLYNKIIQGYWLDPIAYYHWMGTFTEQGVEKYIEYAKIFGELYGLPVEDNGKTTMMPVFPALLHQVEQRRNMLKNMRKKYPHGSPEYEMYDSKQKAAKVVLLAFYGVLGMSSSRWTVLKEIPMSLILRDDDEPDYRISNEPLEKFVGMITHVARSALVGSKDFFDEDKNVEVIYGDSVREDTPIPIKENGMIKYIPIEDLSVSPETNTYSRYKINIDTMDENGWTKSTYVYKHKINKKMYGILTRKGYIECSEDHSLVIDGVEICPLNLSVGKKINLIKYPNLENIDIDKDLAWLIGFYLADGSSGVYKFKKYTKYSWYISQSKENGALKKAQKILSKYGLNTKIINTNCSKNMKKIIPDGNAKLITLLFQKWCHSKRNKKIIPAFVLNSNKKEEFLDGMWIGGKNTKIKELSLTDKTLLAGICNILDSLNKDYSLSIRPDKENIIRLRIIRNKNDKRIRDKDEIISIREINIKNEYIYDIETESHHFVGGIGNVLLHNTDSDFVRPIDIIDNNKTYKTLTKEDMDKLYNFGVEYSKKLEEFFSQNFQEGIDMKLEKIFDRGIFGKVKKVYFCRTIWDEDSGWQYDEDGNLTWYEYTKGLPLVRTDRCEFLKRMQKSTLQTMLDNPEKLMDIWSENVKKLYNNELDHELILRIGVKMKLDQYKNITPAVRAARKLEERGQLIRPGEKVAFVILDMNKTKGISEPVDETLSPEDSIKHLPKITKEALNYYWKKRIWKNIKPFLELVLEETEIMKIENLRTGLQMIDKWF